VKLLNCTNCQDVVKLARKYKTCQCGKSVGYYMEDGLHAEYGGEFAVLFGIANSTIRPAIDATREKPREDGLGWRMEAFVIPDSAPTVKRFPYDVGGPKTILGGRINPV